MAEGNSNVPIQGYLSNNNVAGGSPFSSRVTIESGGFKRFGKLVVVSYVLKSAYTATDNPAVMIGLPGALNPSALSCIESASNPFGSDSVSVACTTRSGNLYIGNMTSGKYYFITGVYFES